MVEVNMRKRDHAKFPNKCVFCSADSPKSVIRLSKAHAPVANLYWLYLALEKELGFEVPACSRCANSYSMRNKVYPLLAIAILILAIVFLRPILIQHLSHEIDKPFGILLAVLFGLYIFAADYCFPPSFSLRIYPDEVDYCFADDELGREFIALNSKRQKEDVPK